MQFCGYGSVSVGSVFKNDVNETEFRIRFQILWYGMFLSFPDPLPDKFVRGTDPRIRIRIRIRTKCHGSPTLLGWKEFILEL
jgi:hypothetical protein